MRLSAIVITKNEAANIIRCLQSLRFADEVVVVDAESTDQTAELARREGARVLRRPWTGYGPQKNFGASHATGEWLLFVDADEEVPPALAEEIRATLQKPVVDFYWLKIITVFLGKPLYHLFGHNPRLFRKSAGQWTGDRVHEQVERHTEPVDEFRLIRLDDRFSRVVSVPLLHHSHHTIGSYLAKMHHYTSLDAERMKATGRHRSGRHITPGFFLPWRLAGRQLLKMVVYRRGLLDGWAGLMWCLLSAYYEYEMAVKFNSKSRNRNIKL